MLPTTFNPGPSKLSEETHQDIRDAMELGILEMSHRSSAFNEMSSAAIRDLRTFFGIPDAYGVYFISSATEAMELTIRNLVWEKSVHFTCGRFSELFAEISRANYKHAQEITAPWGQSPHYDDSKLPIDAECITITANETSTGVMCSSEDIVRIRKARPEAMLAVDITSIAGVRSFPIEQADVWLFSVQKGFGLPSGLGVMIVSPRALNRSNDLKNDRLNLAGTFSFAELDSFMRRGGQTPCTPNVLNIFLLGRQLERFNARGGITAGEKAGRKKATALYEAVNAHPRLTCFVAEPESRSISVACIQGMPEDILRLHALAKEEGLHLGKGYAKLKESTVRVALFPAITDAHVEAVIRVIGKL